MTTAPLPPLPEVGYLGDDASYGYDANDMTEYAFAARADLEAEVAKLREALEAVVSFWDRLNFDGSPINELHTAARSALESKP